MVSKVVHTLSFREKTYHGLDHISSSLVGLERGRKKVLFQFLPMK
jgi:hypothetical protein